MSYFEQLAEQQKSKPTNESSSGEGYFYKLAKGGEQTNEAQIRNEPETKLDNRTQRQAQEQVNAVGGETNVQANGQLRTQDESQRQRNDQASVGQRDGNSVQLIGGEQDAETKSQQADAEGSQRPEAGQGISGQVPPGNQEEVGKGGVQPPAQGFFEEIKTPQGRKAAIASALEEGIPMALGSVAAGVVGPAATAASAPVVGPAAPLVGIGAGAATFLATQELAKKVLVKPVESLLGIKEDIEAAQAEAPTATKYGGYAGMAPFAIESAAGFLKTGAEAAAGLAGGEAVKEATKAVGKKAAAGLAGGVAFEPIRYGFEATEKGLGITDETPKPITGESLLESGLMGAVLGGKVEKELAKNEAGKNEIKSAGLPETAELASKLKPDATIEKENEVALETEKEKPKQVRIGAAAWKNDRTGAIYYGENHEAAVAAARRDAQDPENKDKVAVGDLPKVDVTVPANRETPDFGYITKDGEFVSRDEAQKFAEQSGQFKGKTTDRPVMHSNEVQLDFYEKPLEQPSEQARQLPGAASKGQFTESRLTEAVKAMDDAEKAKGRPLDVGNEGDKRAWIDELNKRFDPGSFSFNELNSLWNQSHEAYRIRNAAGKTIPPELAVQQIGGNRILSQRRIATRNEDINKERASKGLPPVMPGREITQSGAWNTAAEKIAEEPQYLYDLVSDLKKSPRAVTAEETAALQQHMGEIQNDLDSLSEKRNSETDPNKLKEIDAQFDKKLEDFADISQVYKNIGTETSAGLRQRAIFAAADYSLPRLIARKEKALQRKLTTKELREAKADSDKVRKLTDELDGLNSERIEKRQDADIQAETKPPKKKSNLTADEQIEKHKAKLESLKDLPEGKEKAKKISSAMKKLATAITQKRLEEAESKMRRELTEEEEKQVTRPRDISQATHEIASSVLGDKWTLKDSRNAISGYGIYDSPDKTGLSKAVSRLIGVNRNIGKIEDIVKELAPQRTGKQRLKPGAEERSLQKKVNALIRRFNIKAEDPEKQLQGAMEAAKTRARNAVEELEEIFLKGRPLNEEARVQIANEDPDLADLKGEIAGLKQLIEDTYGKKEIPIERKIKSLEKIYDGLIERYEKEIASGEVFKTTTKGEKLTSEKLEQQRETLKNLRAERQHIRDADSLRQETLKVAKAEKRIAEISKILSGDVVDPKTGKNLAEGPESQRVTELRAEVAKAEADLKKYRDSLKVKKTEDEKLLDALNKKKENAEERLARVQTGEAKEKPEQKVARTAEQKEVQKEIDSLNKQIKEYQEANRKRKTEEEKRESLLERQIKNQKEILAKQEIKARETKTKPTSPRIEELEKELATLKDQTMNEDWYKTRKEAIALQAYKNRVNTQIEEAKRRLAEGDYSKAERKELKIDEEARLKKLELAELKDKIRQNITLEEWKNRPPLQKAVDATIKFKRAAVLSYLSTWAKLTSASLEIPLLRIPSAVAGKVLEKTPFFKEIAQKARQEYGTPLDKDVAAYTKGLVSGWKEFSNIAFKLGRSELDLEYGDTSLIPLGALDVPGKIHEAIKNPTKKANYELALSRYLQWAVREDPSIDIKDPVLLEKAGIEAYKEANASIFLQDNGLVNKYNLLVNKMKESDSWRQRLAARFLEFNIPIVRIPANIVKEALEYQFGFFTGTSKAIRMKMSKEIGKRLEDISPEDADLIMRQIKKGSVGLMAMAIGYALPDYFGGFYRKGAEKDEEAPEYGAIGPIPKTLLHHPAFVPFQIGATIRRVWDDTMMDRATFGDDASAIARGFAEGQMGLLEELPFVNLSRNVGKYVDPERITDTAGEFTKSMVPGFIQEAAKVMDVPENSVGEVLKTLFWDKKDVTKRQAETYLDHVKEALPVLREQVPEK